MRPARPPAQPEATTRSHRGGGRYRTTPSTSQTGGGVDHQQRHAAERCERALREARIVRVQSLRQDALDQRLESPQHQQPDHTQHRDGQADQQEILHTGGQSASEDGERRGDEQRGQHDHIQQSFRDDGSKRGGKRQPGALLEQVGTVDIAELRHRDAVDERRDHHDPPQPAERRQASRPFTAANDIPQQHLPAQRTGHECHVKHRQGRADQQQVRRTQFRPDLGHIQMQYAPAERVEQYHCANGGNQRRARSTCSRSVLSRSAA